MKGNKELAKKFFEQADRFYRNAKDILAKVPISYRLYMDGKAVAEASATCYLAVLKALNGYLVLRGMDERNLPRSYYAYLDALKRCLAHNGKVKSALTIVYQNLHIFGYYRDGVNVSVIKEGFQAAKFIIEHFSMMLKRG